MRTPDELDTGLGATLAAMDGTLDPMLAPCPACGANELRAEVRTEWRSPADACEMYGITIADLAAAGARFDSFGRIHAAVPYATCMACGLDADASQAPIGLDF